MDQASSREALVVELRDLPDHLVDTVLDFVRFLKSQASQDRLEPALLSGDVLGKDWLRPEEDEAWANL